MLFLDVTQSCRSSNSSGIQVVTRNLFRELDGVTEVMPMVWDTRLCSYANLNCSELKKLRDPFADGYTPRSRPNKEENPVAKEILATLFRFGRRIKLSSKPSVSDLVVFPEVFRDNRVRHLYKRLHPKLRKTAIFYDANVLRNPEQTPVQRSRNFHAYLNFLFSCNAVSCISKESESVFRELREKGGNSQTISSHPLPVERPVACPPIPLQKPPLILFVSTLAYNKNHLALLSAAEKLWRDGNIFKLEFVGQADPSWTPRVVERIETLVSENRPIEWLRHIDQKTLETRYATCLFTVYPSLFEGCGLPILESLVRGKPCICGDNGALGEVTKDGGCLIIKEQYNPDKIAEGIRTLLKDSALRKRLGKEATSRNFGNWRDYASEILRFFFQ